MTVACCPRSGCRPSAPTDATDHQRALQGRPLSPAQACGAELLEPPSPDEPERPPERPGPSGVRRLGGARRGANARRDPISLVVDHPQDVTTRPRSLGRPCRPQRAGHPARPRARARTKPRRWCGPWSGGRQAPASPPGSAGGSAGCSRGLAGSRPGHPPGADGCVAAFLRLDRLRLGPQGRSRPPAPGGASPTDLGVVGRAGLAPRRAAGSLVLADEERPNSLSPSGGSPRSPEVGVDDARPGVAALLLDEVRPAPGQTAASAAGRGPSTSHVGPGGDAPARSSARRLRPCRHATRRPRRSPPAARPAVRPAAASSPTRGGRRLAGGG